MGEIVGYFRMLASRDQELQDHEWTKSLRLFRPMGELMNPYDQRVYVKPTTLTFNGGPCCWSDISAMYQKHQEEQRWEWIRLGSSRGPITKLPKILFMAPHERPYQIRERDLALWKEEQSLKYSKRKLSIFEQLPTPVKVLILSFLCTRKSGRNNPQELPGYPEGFRSDVFAYFEANPRDHHTLLQDPFFNAMCTENLYQWKQGTRFQTPEDSDPDAFPFEM